MPQLSARIGQELRDAIDEFATRRRLGNSEALRILVVIGCGGTEAEARAVNAEMDRRREIAEAFFRVKRRRDPAPSGRPYATVRLPAPWPARVKAVGGLRAALERGLDVAYRR